MNNFKTDRMIAVALFLGTLWMSTCSTPLFAKEPLHGGTLRISDIYDGVMIGYPPKIFDRAVNSARQVAPAIEALLRMDKTGRPIPWLATEFKVNTAAKTLTLTLRKGIKFHDGTDFNAEAVKWNLEKSMSSRQSGTDKFKAIDAMDDFTVRINLKEWDNTVLSNLTVATGMMISPTAYKKNGEDWCAKNPVGTGPFQFVSWEKDVRTVYKKFPGYWQKGKPYLDGVIWTPVLDHLTRQLSFRRGELDLITDVDRKDVAGLQKDGHLVHREKMGAGATGMVPDSANPNSPFANLKVRQAIQHAIDTKAIVATILYGEAEAANQYSYKGHWGYNPSVVGYPYNPAKAKQLLAEAGYPNGFKTKILYWTPQYDQFFTVVQGYLKTVGIEVQLDPAQRGRYNKVALDGGKWEGLIMSTGSSTPDTALALMERYAGGGKRFTQMFLPDDYIKASQNAVTAPDFEAKQKWVHEVQRLMIDKYCLMIPIASQNGNTVNKTYVHNHGFHGTPNTAWWTPEEAWMEKQ